VVFLYWASTPRAFRGDVENRKRLATFHACFRLEAAGENDEAGSFSSPLSIGQRPGQGHRPRGFRRRRARLYLGFSCLHVRFAQRRRLVEALFLSIPCTGKTYPIQFATRGAFSRRFCKDFFAEEDLNGIGLMMSSLFFPYRRKGRRESSRDEKDTLGVPPLPLFPACGF